MAFAEIIPGVYSVKGKFAHEFGFITSYLVIEDDKCLVIDPGTAGDPGTDLEKAMEAFDIDPRRDVIGIFCTHAHPDHVGGVSRLKKAVNAPVMIHPHEADLLEDPSLFHKDRLLMDFAERMRMKLDRGPLRVNYRGVKPDRLIGDGETIRVGEFNLQVIHTGGHSSGHCVLYESAHKILFSGDEVNNFPNDPRKFYIDLSGSMAMKNMALDKLSSLSIEYLLPSHDVPHLFNEVGLQFEEVRDGIRQFQDAVLVHLKARGEADINQLAYDIIESRSAPVPTTLDALLLSTITVSLRTLEKAGVVESNEKGVWTAV
jgi:glyoxylase-like metal-dependent hydrolase (beta-lactamase superfamily II)